VGIPIVGTTIKILDLETQKEKAVGEEGMIYVASSSVFQ
jgi:acyl-CoA synthetase (AMP-forming)/AMP-acid ligase II